MSNPPKIDPNTTVVLNAQVRATLVEGMKEDGETCVSPVPPALLQATRPDPDRLDRLAERLAGIPVADVYGMVTVERPVLSPQSPESGQGGGQSDDIFGMETVAKPVPKDLLSSGPPAGEINNRARREQLPWVAPMIPPIGTSLSEATPLQTCPPAPPPIVPSGTTFVMPGNLLNRDQIADLLKPGKVSKPSLEDMILSERAPVPPSTQVPAVTQSLSSGRPPQSRWKLYTVLALLGVGSGALLFRACDSKDLKVAQVLSGPKPR